MDDFRLWFKRETETFKTTYSTAVDCYHDLVLSQMEPITGLSGNESTHELSQLIRQIANTKTMYQQHLDWLSRRYFKAKPVWSAFSSTISDSTFVTNPIILSQPSQVNTFADYSTTYQQQQANGIPFSGFPRIDYSPVHSPIVSESSSDLNIDQPITNSSTLDGQFNGSSATSSFSSAASEAPSEIQTEHEASMSVGHCPTDSGSPGLPESESLRLSVGHSETVPFKYVCTFTGCTVFFDNKPDFTRHLLKHNKGRLFACDQCLLAFTTKSDLTCHARIHSAFKPYVCTWPECNYSANLRHSVYQHVRTVHFGLPKTKKEQVARRIIDTRDARQFTEKLTVLMGISETPSEQASSSSVSQSGLDSDFSNEPISVEFIEVKCEFGCAPDCECHLEDDIPSTSENCHEADQGQTQKESHSVLISPESGNSTVTASNSDNVLIKNEIESDSEIEQVNVAQVEQAHDQEQHQALAETTVFSAVTPIIASGTATSLTGETPVIEQVDNSSDNNVEEQDDAHSMMNANDEAADEDASDSETITAEEFADEATEDEPGPAPANLTVDFFSLPSTSTGRRSTRALKKVNYAEATEDFSAGNSAGLGSEKRPKDLSGKSSAPKRVRVEPVVADVEDESESEEKAVPFSIIVLHLNCPEAGCKKKCMNKAQLNEHLLVKHQIGGFRCKLKDCTVSFATQSELNDHRKSAHSNLKDWPCAQCETICHSNNELGIHFLKNHEQGKFACSAEECTFTEKTRRRVENHQLKHRNRKYPCTFAGCTASFYGKSDYTRHFRVHSKEKPFACDQCPRAFSQKCALTVHERRHSGLKPYNCTWPQCDFASCDRSNVHSHVRLVHFGLPATKKEQGERGIIDNRDARAFIYAV